MPMSGSFLHKESLIKKEMTRIYKVVAGKGPENTEVKIYQNFVMMKFMGAFTPIEENLLKTDDGLRIVQQIRDELILYRTEKYIPKLEQIIEEKVETVNYMMDEKNRTIYIFVLFADFIK
jgi:uncharacterized protein YbcI